MANVFTPSTLYLSFMCAFSPSLVSATRLYQEMNNHLASGKSNHSRGIVVPMISRIQRKMR